MTGPLDEVPQRLCVEFERWLESDTVADIGEQCRDELETAPEPVLPERVERLARRRLSDTTVYTVTGALDYGLRRQVPRFA